MFHAQEVDSLRSVQAAEQEAAQHQLAHQDLELADLAAQLQTSAVQKNSLRSKLDEAEENVYELQAERTVLLRDVEKQREQAGQLHDQVDALHKHIEKLTNRSLAQRIVNKKVKGGSA